MQTTPDKNQNISGGITQEIIDLLDGLRQSNSNTPIEIDPWELGKAYEDSIASESAKTKKRKSTGTYYTPKFVIDYIVEKTLSPLITEAKRITKQNPPVTLEESAYLKIKILDPAMGCGFFLMGALDYMTSSIASDRNILSPDINHIRKLVLKNCIYGIDIDPTAVKIAGISLWLYLTGIRENISEIDSNLVCANALTQYEQTSLKWGIDGFDAVVGNPPYLFGENIPKEIRQKKYDFDFAVGQFDVYWLFYEMAIKSYLRDGGCHGYIVPDAILARDETSVIRKEITKSHQIIALAHVGQVFDAPNVSAAVVIWQKNSVLRETIELARCDGEKFTLCGRCNQSDFALGFGVKWLVHLDGESRIILNNIFSQSVPLGEIANISRGEEIGKSKLVSMDTSESVPILAGSDIFTLAKPITKRAIKYEDFRKALVLYASPKIAFVKTGKKIVAAMDYENLVTLQSIYNIHCKSRNYKPEYICALLSSDLLSWVAMITFTNYKSLFPQFNQTTVMNLPIKEIDFKTSESKKQKMLKEATSYYASGETDLLMKYVRRLITANFNDVIHDLLVEIVKDSAKLESKSESNKNLIDEIVCLLYDVNIFL